mmetsp:Transcript_2878/g.7274  ORF Transcript_2878/g.7274 Transcript_2878/m.7274 type:complete len:472 (+) Transcript_2878:83-1498(+)
MALSEVELMGECSPLYASFALESLANALLAFFFLYLSALITSKGKLKTPARDSMLFCTDVFNKRFKDVMSVASQWQDMPNQPLEKRFRWCRKVNATICQFSALVAILAVTRWLHINNVNGFRYLGYAFTCPPMQAELLVLIAPAVPCYRHLVVVSSSMTFMMLMFGWAASGIQDDLWTGKFMDWVDSSFEEELGLTTKGWCFVCAAIVLMYLSVIQLPFLLLCYSCKGGPKAGLPEGYPRMIGLVFLTWLCFPIWWSISFEGFKLIEDTKMNGIGFVVLNLISKGGFTMSVLRMVRLHKEKGLIRSSISTQNDWLGQLRNSEPEKQKALPDIPARVEQDAGDAAMNGISSQVSGDAWFTSVLEKYEVRSKSKGTDSGSGALPLVPESESSIGRNDSKTTNGAVHIKVHGVSPGGLADLNTYSHECLMQEVMRRLAAGEMTLVPTQANSGGARYPLDEDDDLSPVSHKISAI